MEDIIKIKLEKAIEKAVLYCNENGIAARRVVVTEDSLNVIVKVKLEYFLIIKKIDIILFGEYDITDDYIKLYGIHDAISMITALTCAGISFEFDAEHLSITLKDFEVLDYDGKKLYLIYNEEDESNN